jgi:flagellar biosynthesis/type III secretory pathway M-ring protein FliF/YscJ
MEWTETGTEWRPAVGTAGMAQASIESMDGLTMVRGYGPQVGLGMLALLSLFMMMRIVRSVPQRPPSVTSAASKPSPVEEEEFLLATGSGAVGKASVSESLLVGREVDDETLRYQELTEEVTKLVEADPESAAELLKRWMEDA